MKNKYNLFLASFIPFSLALMLVYFGTYILTPINESTYVDEKTGAKFYISEAPGPPLEQQIYVLFIISLFLLAFALPFFVYSRDQSVR